MRALVFIFIACACASCRRWESPAFEPQNPATANTTLGDLRVLCGGAAGEGRDFVIKNDVVVSGRVVSSEGAGNFYNSFFIDDGTGAAEITAGMTGLDAAFRLGQRVTVRARGVAVGWRDGAMRIGLPPDAGSAFSTGYFYHPAVMRTWVTPERDIDMGYTRRSAVHRRRARLALGREEG